MFNFRASEDRFACASCAALGLAIPFAYDALFSHPLIRSGAGRDG